jgi:Haem-binding domain
LKKTKKILLYVLLPLLLVQFIPVDRENPSVDKMLALSAPQDVSFILTTSCYDCHSNETNWPFYSYIAPVSWLVSRDVKSGREDLNFSEWNKMTENDKKKAKEEIIEEISRDTMPMPIYLVTHPSASLSREDKLLLKNWLSGRKTEQSIR